MKIVVIGGTRLAFVCKASSSFTWPSLKGCSYSILETRNVLYKQPDWEFGITARNADRYTCRSACCLISVYNMYKLNAWWEKFSRRINLVLARVFLLYRKRNEFILNTCWGRLYW